MLSANTFDQNAKARPAVRELQGVRNIQQTIDGSAGGKQRSYGAGPLGDYLLAGPGKDQGLAKKITVKAAGRTSTDTSWEPRW